MNKYLKNIRSHLEEKYGKSKTDLIMEKALKRFDELIEENKDEPKEYYMHTRERIYPAIAAFDAMLSEGVDRKETAQFLVDYYKWRANTLAPKIKLIFGF